MYSKWCDAYSQLMGFITTTEKIKENADCRKLEHYRMEITHFFSLLSAVASERLMRVPWSQQIVFRENLRGTDLTGAKQLFPMRVLLMNPQSFLPTSEDRSSDQYDEDNMHQSLSAPPHSKPAGGSVRWMSVVTKQNHPLSRNLCRNLDEGAAGTDLWKEPQRIVDQWKEPVTVVGELSSEEFRRLRLSEDRVNLVLLWINELVANLAPQLAVAPPIISRVFQEISNGALGYSQAEKLSDIPFPFIFAQLLAVALIFIAIVSPICFTLITGDSFLTPLVSTGVVTSFWALNEMAKELENPFGNDANNVPLLDAHERFIEFLTEMHGICLPRDRDYRPPPPEPGPGSKAGRSSPNSTVRFYSSCRSSGGSTCVTPAVGSASGAQREPQRNGELEVVDLEAPISELDSGLQAIPESLGVPESTPSQDRSSTSFMKRIMP